MRPGALAKFLVEYALDELSDKIGYAPAWRMSGTTRYLSQRALALCCEANGGAPYIQWGIEGRPRLLDLESYRGVGHGVAWIRIEDLGRFATHVLPHLHEQFVLVTGESDYSVPSDFPAEVDAVVKSGLVRRWFTNNYDGSAYADLMRPLPLGLKYKAKHDIQIVGHKLLIRPRTHAASLEALWKTLAADAPPLARRRPIALGDFWLNDTSKARRYGESRADIHAQLRRHREILFPSTLMRPADLWKLYSEHAFVVSPHGRGLDCYRTWEALLFGCIPIVKRSPLDVLYRDLPVAIVDDWREITRANLDGWLARFGAGFDRQPLAKMISQAHWVNELRRA